MQINKQQRQNLITYSMIKTIPRLKGQSDIAMVLRHLLLPEFPRLPSGGSLYNAGTCAPGFSEARGLFSKQNTPFQVLFCLIKTTPFQQCEWKDSLVGLLLFHVTDIPHHQYLINKEIGTRQLDRTHSYFTSHKLSFDGKFLQPLRTSFSLRSDSTHKTLG